MHAVDKGALPNLKVLLLAGCASIIHLPDMSSLRNLETLNISECTSLANLPRGLAKLPKLRHLNVRAQTTPRPWVAPGSLLPDHPPRPHQPPAPSPTIISHARDPSSGRQSLCGRLLR